MKHVFIRGYANLWPYLSEKCGEGFDKERSMALPRMFFSTSEGEEVHCGSIQHLLQELNERFGTDFEPMASRSARNNFFSICLEGEDEVAEPVKVNAASLVSLAPQEEVENAPREQDQSEEENGEEVSAQETKKVDWKWIESLQDNASDKKELKAYAKESLDVELKGNKKLANLIADLKEALEA